MAAIIHCPACCAAYNVPDVTPGRVAKCSKYANVFVGRVADSSASAAIGTITTHVLSISRKQVVNIRTRQ